MEIDPLGAARLWKFRVAAVRKMRGNALTAAVLTRVARCTPSPAPPAAPKVSTMPACRPASRFLCLRSSRLTWPSSSPSEAAGRTRKEILVGLAATPAARVTQADGDGLGDGDAVPLPASRS